MNAFAPRYDPSTGRVVMYPHPDGAWVHVGDALEMKDEVERLREEARKVHALAESATTPKAMRDWKFDKIANAFREIHKITKGMVA